MMTAISAAIITKNEAKNLPDCLISLRDLCQEVIVVDSGSTDNTLELAKSYGAKTHARAFDDFASQKNYAISLCTKPWILLIDADERVSPELAVEIGRILEDTQKPFDAYYLKRLNHLFGRFHHHGINADDWQLRLVKNGKGLFEGRIHERLQVKGHCGYLKHWLLHYSSQTQAQYNQKLTLYAGMEAQNLRDKGVRAGWIDLNLRPAVFFIYHYFFRLGFLDGLAGLRYHWLSASYIHHKYKLTLNKN